ncbi:MAG: protein-export chaperone SecB [Gammaproteobacteria bacterium]|nr:MAG: protein-export chaperone SecB [Gammaproteobacteria bacterium]
MSEAGRERAAGQGGEPLFAIQRLYLKDASFETPNAPGIFGEAWEPEVSVQLSNAASQVEEDLHEVVLTVTVTAKLGERTAFLCEVQQAGLFQISGYGPEDLEGMVGAFCPSILFPYAREAISDLVVKGGFPALVLAPINFDALYRQHKSQLAEQGGAAAGTAPGAGEPRH